MQEIKFIIGFLKVLIKLKYIKKTLIKVSIKQLLYNIKDFKKIVVYNGATQLKFGMHVQLDNRKT